MIVDLKRFVQAERAYWEELAARLDELESVKKLSLGLEAARRLNYLYERTGAALARMGSFGADPQLREYLESLVGRAYALIHSAGRPRRRLGVRAWLFGGAPATFRRHVGAFWLACAVTAAGMLFGGLALSFDPQAKDVFLGDYAHLRIDPGERVAREAQHGVAHEMPFATFAAGLMTHNIRVSILVAALGMTAGVGTIIVLFINGTLLGAVLADYVLAGQGVFVAGWLLPHGTVEIPAILIAAQAGLVLAGAMIGRGSLLPLRRRFVAAAPAVASLVGLAAMLLVWAGIVESFISQFHAPAVPYAVKIALGLAELTALGLYLGLAGRGDQEAGDAQPPA